MSIVEMTPSQAARDRGFRQGMAPHDIPDAKQAKAQPSGPHQIGTTALANVETLTSASAEEIERVADALERAAHEEAEGLRAFAAKLRRTGVLANEQLANYVRVASTCAEAGRMMQATIADRNEPQAPPPALSDASLDAIEREIGTIVSASGAADHDQA